MVDVLPVLRLLDSANLVALRNFAERYLAWRGLPRHSGEDLVQQAILALLVGRELRAEGRHPRRSDLADIPTFLAYLRGVIRSQIDAQRARREQAFHHVEWQEDLTNLVCAEAQFRLRSADKHLEFRDLSEQLFRRLRTTAPPRLQQLVMMWQQLEPDSSRIPTAGRHRRLRAELRKLSKQTLKELGAVPDGNPASLRKARRCEKSL